MTIATNQFGYNLMRNDVLHDLLGSEHDAILYWVGKSLARKYPLETTEQMIDFFTEACWGQLTLIKEKKQQKIYELTGQWMGKEDKRCYQLEAGFLAEQTESSLKVMSSATYLQKKNVVVFTVDFDSKDHIKSELA